MTSPMVRSARLHARTMCALLIILLAVMTSATCLAESADQDTCCAQMAGRCNAGMTQDQGCCPKAPTLQDQIAGKDRVSIAAPSVTELALIALPDLATPLLSGTASVTRYASSPPPRGVPPYLLLSILRV